MKINKKELIELIGKETTFKFEFFEGGVAEYKTCFPKMVNENLTHYRVRIFTEEKEFFDYQNLEDLLNYKVYEVVEIFPDMQEDYNFLFRKTYDKYE